MTDDGEVTWATADTRTRMLMVAFVLVPLALLGWYFMPLTGRLGEHSDLVHQCYEAQRVVNPDGGRWRAFGECEREANRTMIRRYGVDWRD